MEKIDCSVDEIVKKFSSQNEVLAIAIGGSRATGKADDKSDYDIYVYIQNTLENNSRNDILSPYCSYMEIGNRYWETEDNCILKNGVFIDIIYRNFSAFVQTVADVLENGLCYNGYTTCMWHNIMTCKIVYDKNSDLAKIKEGLNIIINNYETIKNAKLILFTCGLADYKIENINNINKRLEKIIPENIKSDIKIFYLRGGINYKKLNLKHKIMMKMLKTLVIKKEIENINEEGKDFIETYGQTIDFTNKENVEEIIRYCKE